VGQERDKLVNALARFGIDAKRILYIGAEQNETRLYASESAELLRRFFALYPIPPHVVVFSDNGKSFFPGSVSALESLGFAKHVSYPHPYISTSRPMTTACMHGEGEVAVTVEWTLRTTWNRPCCS